jgi:hypothetical protein
MHFFPYICAEHFCSFAKIRGILQFCENSWDFAVLRKFVGFCSFAKIRAVLRKFAALFEEKITKLAAPKWTNFVYFWQKFMTYDIAV